MDTFDPGQIIAMERAALDRWGAGDPRGYLEIMASEVTYFDPSQKLRVDGLPAMTNLLEPLTGKIRVDRYDMIGPLVQRHGEAAILTFNLVSYRRRPDGSEHAIARWNSTETYARVDDARDARDAGDAGDAGGRWRIVHSHWSFTTPALQEDVSELA